MNFQAKRGEKLEKLRDLKKGIQKQTYGRDRLFSH